jgi:DNA polymerase III psi subunit
MNYLDLSLNRTDNQINLNIYRKPTQIDITIHFTSNHPHLQNLAAFYYFIQRLNSLPITHKAKEQEWQQILTTAHNNGFPEHIIQ